MSTDIVTVSLDHWNRLQSELKELRSITDEMDTVVIKYSGRGVSANSVQYIGSDEAMKKLADQHDSVASKLAESEMTAHKHYMSIRQLESDLRGTKDLLDRVMRRSLFERITNKDPREC